MTRTHHDMSSLARAGRWHQRGRLCSEFTSMSQSSRMLTINEIFHSIQGESTHAGRPCVFVRLTACDLRCSWCDTPYAFTGGAKMSVDDVLAEVARPRAAGWSRSPAASRCCRRTSIR